MCDHPLCPTYDGTASDTPEHTEALLVQCTTAAVEVMRLLQRGWMRGAQGITKDVDQKWRFPGVTRLMWVYAHALSVFPVPERVARDLSEGRGMREYVAQLPEHMQGQTIGLTDQVDAAREDLVSLTRSGVSYGQFAERFDRITDTPGMLSPLLMSCMIFASCHFQEAAARDLHHLVDQFTAAITADFDFPDDEFTELRDTLFPPTS